MKNDGLPKAEHLLNITTIPEAKYDLKASEINIIRERNFDKLGHVDVLDLMYDSYSLGYAKGLIKGKEVKE